MGLINCDNCDVWLHKHDCAFELVDNKNYCETCYANLETTAE